MKDSFAATLSADHLALLETLELVAGRNPGSTILPTFDVETQQIEAVAEHLATRGEVVLLGQTLGEGGMGIVKLGTQTSLGREVAVKAVRDHRASVPAATKLVQEAWVTGSLEHPNIVPVYELARGEDDAPLLVMRRIVGQPWSELIGDEEAVRQQFGVDDVVEWHVRVLMQLASALEFAHGRRILHLDLKPDNVMIGPLGEVYLVDWGLAMSLDDDARLPSAAKNTALIGTPAFIAPEMLTGDGTLLGPPTDVYLLGATLYAALAGAPPHRGDTLIAVVYQALEGTPTPLPANVPPELAAVVLRAMAREPEERFPSPNAVRQALQEFLEHRGSLALVAKADERRAELERLLAEGGDEGVVAAASEARFGYSQALAAWSGSEAARQGLDAVTAKYAIWCAERGELSTAEGLAAQLSGEFPELDAALEAARERAAAEAARVRELEVLGRQLDTRTGQRTRVIILGAVVLFAGAVPIATPFVPGLLSWEMVIAFPIVCSVIVGGLTFWGRESMSATRVNRGGTAAMLAMLLCQLLVTVRGHQFGLAIDETMALVFPLWALTAALFALTIERGLWPTAAAFVVGSVVTAVWPSSWLVATTLCNFTALGNFLAVWKPGQSRSAAESRGELG